MDHAILHYQHNCNAKSNNGGSKRVHADDCLISTLLLQNLAKNVQHKQITYLLVYFLYG